MAFKGHGAASYPLAVRAAIMRGRNKHLLVRCAWCKRVRLARGEWREAARLVAAAQARGVLSHGICPDCFHRLAPPGAEYPEET